MNTNYCAAAVKLYDEACESVTSSSKQFSVTLGEIISALLTECTDKRTCSSSEFHPAFNFNSRKMRVEYLIGLRENAATMNIN